MTNTNKVEWVGFPGQLNYASSDGKYIAIYKNTSHCGRGANYLVFRADLDPKKRNGATAISVGGLPKYL